MSEESIIYRLRGDKIIWIIVFLLSLISIAAVYSSSSAVAFMEKKTTLHFLFKQMRFVVFGLTALYSCYKIPVKWFRRLAYLGMIVSIGLLLLTLLIGKNINGAERWIVIFGMSFQPAEVAKIGTILYLAKVFEDCEFKTFKEFMLLILIPVGVVVLLIMQGSVSTALLFSVIAFILIMISGIKTLYIFKSIPYILALAAVIFSLHLAFGMFPRISTATERVKTHIFGENKKKTEAMNAEELQKLSDKTLQEEMAKTAIGSSGIIGKGPGNSTQRYVLPHPYSDFIFAIIVEEYGMLGGLFIILLYLWFLFRCFTLARACTKKFTGMAVLGLSILITMQALLHILVNVNLIPVTGHTLPLISLGGTSLIIMGGAFGIILSVSRTIEVGSQKKKEELKKEKLNETEIPDNNE